MTKPDAPITQNSLAAIDVAGIAVVIATGELEIKPIKVKQLPAFAKAIAPLAGLEFLKPRATIVKDGESAGFDVDIGFLLQGTYADDFINAVAIGSNLSRDALDNLDLADLINLGAAVLEVNLDFFTQRLMPQLSQITQNLLAKQAIATAV